MRTTILALVAVLVAAGPAFAAGGAKGDWELGIYGGYGWLDNYGVLNPKKNAFYGGNIGYFLTKNWSLEASGQRLGTNTDYDDPLVPNVDVHWISYRLNLLFNFGGPETKVRPFLTGGGNADKLVVEKGGDSHDIGWNAGGGLRFMLGEHWNLRTEGRYVRTKPKDIVDESQGNWEARVGLGALLGKKHEEEHTEAPPPPPPNQPPTVSCAADRAEILPGETVTIHATATDPENGPITYAWTTSAGQVTGTGPAATLDFTGVTPPSSATVTVRVTDDHGNPAQSDCSVRLLEPVKKAEAVSCVSGGFPRNLSRLTNVDKACLDDVIQRLGGDPRSTVVVIGYSDSHETTKGIDQKRADAVRDYLVKEHGIDAARVTTRASGSTKPVSTGTDAASMGSNRRVEVWFVPDGATMPGG